MSKTKRRPPETVSPPGTTPPACVESPTECPACGATDHHTISISADRPIAGATPAGHSYRRIAWVRVRCKGCGQLFTLRRLLAN